jgi:hypothetical protein
MVGNASPTTERVKRTCSSTAHRAGHLGVLGAGNCNDLDLPRLATGFDAIHLVDLDDDTVRRARTRAQVEVAAKLTVRAPLDLSGALNELPRWRGKLLSPAQLAAFSRSAFDNVVSTLPERFDTVLSACLLSQIVHGCYVALGTHPQLSELATALATVHLRALTELARPGGRVLFVTDTVSSETYPLRELWGREPPLDLLASLDRVGNVLSGTSVSFVRRVLAGEGSRLAGRPSSSASSLPCVRRRARFQKLMPSARWATSGVRLIGCVCLPMIGIP